MDDIIIFASLSINLPRFINESDSVLNHCNVIRRQTEILRSVPMHQWVDFDNSGLYPMSDQGGRCSPDSQASMIDALADRERNRYREGLHHKRLFLRV